MSDSFDFSAQRLLGVDPPSAAALEAFCAAWAGIYHAEDLAEPAVLIAGLRVLERLPTASESSTPSGWLAAFTPATGGGGVLYLLHIATRQELTLHLNAQGLFTTGQWVRLEENNAYAQLYFVLRGTHLAARHEDQEWDIRLGLPAVGLRWAQAATAPDLAEMGWLIQPQGELLGGKAIPLVNGLVIGRSVDSGLVIADPQVSRQHARIEMAGEVFQIVDLGSSNGTFLNGDRLSGSALLHEGDLVRIGPAVFAIQPPAFDIPVPESVPLPLGASALEPIPPEPAPEPLPPASEPKIVFDFLPPPPAPAPVPLTPQPEPIFVPLPPAPEPEPVPEPPAPAPSAPAPVRAFCGKCGSELTPGARFCGTCGAPQAA
jgi:hypothetical protein